MNAVAERMAGWSAGTRHRSLWRLTALLVIVLGLAAGLGRLQKDDRLDAFVPRHSAALETRERAARLFGLSEPIAIALVSESPEAVLAPDRLQAVRELSTWLSGVPGVRAGGVMSLATAPWVAVEHDELLIRRMLPPGPIDAATADAVRAGLVAAPAYRGLLVSDDLSSTLILAELTAQADAGEVYEDIRRRIGAVPLPPGVALHIAGSATVSGFISRYVDRDTRVLIPLGVVVILVLVTVLLRRPSAPCLAAFIMAGTLLGTLGLMGWMRAPIYVITSSLPALLLCVSVADSIHLLALIYRIEATGASRAEAVRISLSRLAVPMTLTSLTTVFGFLGIAIGSELPAMQQYGLFAAWGVFLAWALTLFAAPLLYLLWPHRGGPVPQRPLRRARPRLALGAALGRGPRWQLGLAAALLAVGLWGLSALQFNNESVRNFGRGSEVFQADRLINQRFNGSYQLDVLLQAGDGADLLAPATQTAIGDLQRWMAAAGGLAATRSYVDLIRETRAAAQPDADAVYAETAESAAQWLFLREALGEPGDLDRYITPDRSAAYLHGYLRTDNYQQTAPLIARLRQAMSQHLDGTGIRADLTGPVHVTNSWVGPLLPNTVAGMAVALALVGLLSGAMLRSVGLGILCLLPVTLAVFFVFGLMGLLGIWLDVVTSMFAAISIGLGVDFSVHMLHALRRAEAAGCRGAALAQQAYAEVGWPLGVNALVLISGVAVVIFSAIPPVAYFGLLTASAVASAYVATLLILPPWFVLRSRRGP